MRESEIMYLCRKLGGTVYETVGMADQETLVALREFIEERVPAKSVKVFVHFNPRQPDRCPETLMERARPILAELLADPGRRFYYHSRCPSNLNMGQFLSQVVAAVESSCNGSGSDKMTDEVVEFLEQAEAVGCGSG